MAISVILGHPGRESFNHAIAETVVKTLRNIGHAVHLSEKHKPVEISLP